MQNTNKFCLFLGPVFLTTLFWEMTLCGETLGAEFDDGLKRAWPQWRGPNSSGVSSEQNLPEIWNSNTQNIRWKVRIQGEGFSSPTVSNGRVILTTAYESSKVVILRTYVGIVSFALAVAFCTAAGINFFRKNRRETQKKIAPAKGGLAESLNQLFTWITSFGFVCVALVSIIRPEYFDVVFGKIDFLVSSLGGYHSHLLSMAKGAPGAVWLTSGGIALLGLAVSVGFLKAQSIWRLLSVGMVFFAASLFVKFTPLDQWKLEIGLHKRLIFTLPGLLVASCHILNSINVHLRRKNILRFGDIRALFFVLLLIGLSALVFIPPNFMQSQLEVQRVVVCVDMKSGSILWEQPVFIAPAERKHSENTYATPTAATDGKHIFVSFGLGIACLDFEGRILWRQSDKQYSKNSRYGAVSSPLLVDDMVIAVQEREWGSKRPTWIAVFDKRTGRIRWNIEPTNIYQCYTTGLLYRDGADIQLLISSCKKIASYDIESGKCLWMQEIPMQNLVASMVRSGELLCIAGGTYGPKATIIMRLNGKGKDTKVDVLWQSSRDAPGCSSPVIYDDKLFVVTDTGIMTCYEVVSGTLHWKKRLRGRYLSSLVAGDGKVYACNTKGVTTVIAADSKLKVLAENDLEGSCYASPAIADGCILIRIANHLYCIEKEGQ